MEFVRGTELIHVMKQVKMYYQFYLAEVICGLEAMHSLGIVYRDLKPEHVLIDNTGHCKMVDFGFAKRLVKGKKTFTNCGTADYVAPEVLKSIGTGFEADVWSLGVLLHELCSGTTPFWDVDPVALYENVVKCRP